MGEHRDFKFGTQRDDKPSLKWVWLCSCDPFNFSIPPKISPEWLKLDTSHWSPCDDLALALQTVSCIGVVMIT